MCAAQRELRNAAVIEHPRLPSDRAVAGRANLAQRAGVIVVLGVAAGAVFFGIVKCHCRMAGAAILRGMCADERKRSEPMIEPHVGLPRCIPVAVRAFRAELPAMRIRGMAGDAIRGRLRAGVARVTVAALCLRVCTGEAEARGARMIEAGRSPLHGRVTLGAVVPETAAMHVLALVTAHAGARQRRCKIDRVT